MDSSVTLPWLAEIGIITWRTVRNKQRPPLPSELLATFVVFGAFGVVGTRQPRIAASLGWAVVVATFLNFGGTGDKLTQPTGKAKPATERVKAK